MSYSKYLPKIGDFVAKKIPDTDWVITGVVVDYVDMTNFSFHKILWSPNPNFPVSGEELYESYENLMKVGAIIIRSEKDIPEDFLPPT